MLIDTAHPAIEEAPRVLEHGESHEAVAHSLVLLIRQGEPANISTR